MATASKIHLEALQKPQFYVQGLTSESAEKASQLLQANHDQYHTFFNSSGFHNHITHHMLTLFALNASPEELQKAYDANVSYQRPVKLHQKSSVSDMHDPERFKSYLGKEKYYHDFLVYFQQEIDKKGWQATLQEYVFCQTPRADDMLVRMFSGVLHPIIHLGFGIEFQQPAIIAEALAQAAVHNNWMASLFLECEKAAREHRGKKASSPSIVEILEQCRNNDTLRNSVKYEDADKLRHGVLKRAPREMIRHAAQYTVDEEEDIEKKTAEMINASIYFTAAAQHPPHEVKFDFFFIHSVTSSIFFSAFLAPSSSLAPAVQRRLLEWKVWYDVSLYVSQGSPRLLLGEIKHSYDYNTAARSDNNNNNNDNDDNMHAVIARARQLHDDDGHASKLVRALAHASSACAPWDAQPGFAVKGRWCSAIANMVLHGIQAGDPQWVRSCGFDQAWGQVPVREGGEGEGEAAAAKL